MSVEVELVDNSARKLLDTIRPVMAQSDDCRIAVAYVSFRGLELLDPAIRECLERGGCIEFLVGLDLLVTDPQALWSLHRMSQAEPNNVAYFCLSDLGPSAVYHPKLYVLKSGDAVTMVIGSSNLTEGGLRQNVEVNALLRATTQDEITSDVYGVYNSLKFHPKRIRPDEEFLAFYEEAHAARARGERLVRRESRLRELTSRLQAKGASLSHPVPTKKDLFGWQKLVFERLPEGPFRTSDLYRFEEEFRHQYPANQNIRAKARQILQQLEDLRLVRHLRKGWWIREWGL